MTPDELAAIKARAIHAMTTGTTLTLVAEVERLTPRIIETREELDSLPPWTVIRENEVDAVAVVWERNGYTGRWMSPSGEHHDCQPELPATVLYLPE